MSLITATDLAKSYGAQDVFEGVSLAIPYQARMALVGPNGVGKTTLLRLLANRERPDRGRVLWARGLQIGYLPQEISFSRLSGADLEFSLWENCSLAFSQIRAWEAELARLEAEMGDPAKAEKAISRYGTLQERFEREGGYTYPFRIKQVLNGLGFAVEDYDRPLSQFSGGQRTRSQLARLLLDDPDLLVLDEPTNHLDIEAVEWLEKWLRDWPGAALIVSHDRYFLDRVVDTVLELFPHGLERYRGNYSAFVAQRAERRELHQSQYKAQQAFVRRERDYIQRNIAGQNTRQAQGRRKRLERYLRDHALNRLTERRGIQIDFGHTARSGDHVLKTQDLVIGYQDALEPLFNVPDLLLLRGECAALIGPNGVGKTTFLKTILGEVPPIAGNTQLGASLKVGYFAQAHEELDSTRTIVEEIYRVAPDMKRSEAYDFLAEFLFYGDAIDKPIETLSGGERGRVALAKLVLEGANFLLLDEPTNHLDLPSQDTLQVAMEAFPGTILLVSHDRYLIDALATQIWHISADSRSLYVFPGNYSAYQETRKEGEEGPKSKPRPTAPAPAPQSERKPSSVELAEIEKRIGELERALEELAREIEAAGSNPEQLHRLGNRYNEIQTELETELATWERLAEQSPHA